MAVTLNSTGITFSDGTSISSPTTLNGIGSHIWAYYAVTGPATANRYSYLGVGATVAGSSLRYSTAATASNVTTTYLPYVSTGDATSAAFPTTGTAALSGTWRALGGTPESPLNTARNIGAGPYLYMASRDVEAQLYTRWLAVFFVRIS